MSKTFMEFMAENKVFDLGDNRFSSEDGVYIKLECPDGCTITSNNDDEIYDFYCAHNVGEFRVCEVCGKPYDQGYMHDGGGHWCSDECVAVDANERYSQWKWIGDASKEELEQAYGYEVDDVEEFLYADAVGCLIYKFEGDEEWQLDETFYTEWF